MAIIYFKIIILIIEMFLILLENNCNCQCAYANNSEAVYFYNDIFSRNQSVTSLPQSSSTTRTMSKLFEQFFKSYAAKRRAHLAKMFSKSTSTTSSTKDNTHIDPVSRMVWLDMELTGLDLETDRIMEVACVITESNLDIIAKAPTFIIHHPKEILDKMGPWCQEQHAKTGLIDECLKSNTSLEEVDEQLYNLVKKYIPEGKGCVAGNSVYMDKWFVIKYLPKLNAHLHYRLIDVSTLKELCRKWRNEDFKKIPEKAYVHRALDDIMESIEELKHYKKILFDK